MASLNHLAGFCGAHLASGIVISGEPRSGLSSGVVVVLETLVWILFGREEPIDQVDWVHLQLLSKVLLDTFQQLLSVAYERFVCNFIQPKEVLVSPKSPERQFVQSNTVCVCLLPLVNLWFRLVLLNQNWHWISRSNFFLRFSRLPIILVHKLQRWVFILILLLVLNNLI